MANREGYVEATAGDLVDRRYRIRHEVARGAMGVVFEAEHVLTRQVVALKMLTSEVVRWPVLQERLMREARALGLVRHPGIVQVLDAGTCERHGTFVTLERIEGRSLDGLLTSHGRLSAATVVGLAKQLGAALHAVHALGVIHRDVKPGNILLRGGDPERGDVLKLIDFGIASLETDDDVTERKLTGQSELLGTLEYMAPEQILAGAPATRATDIYAMGATLYECLMGDVPYPGKLGEILQAHTAASGPPRLQSGDVVIPEALEAAILKALARRPEDRFATAEELAAACAAALPGSRTPLQLVTLTPAQSASSRRRHARAPYFALIRILTQAGHCDGHVEDISEGGLLAVTSGACEEGEVVRVRLPLPVSGRVATLEGKARWSKTRRGQRAIGVEFLAPDAAVTAEIGQYVTAMLEPSKTRIVGADLIA